MDNIYMKNEKSNIVVTKFGKLVHLLNKEYYSEIRGDIVGCWRGFRIVGVKAKSRCKGEKNRFGLYNAEIRFKYKNALK